MKTVLCEVDSKRELLCDDCRKRYENKEFSELDVSISRILGRLEKNFPIVNVEFKKALDLQELIVLVCQGNIGSLIGKKGRIVSELTKSIGKKVRVIEQTPDEKKMIQDLVGTARVLGVNKVFKPTKKEYRIIVSKRDEDKLITSKENLENGIKELLKAEATIEFS